MISKHKRRPHLMMLALGLTSSLVIAACGSNNDDTAQTTRVAESSTAASTAPASSAAPTTASGDTTATDAPGATAEADDPLAPQPLAERTSITLGLSNYNEPYLSVYLPDIVGELEKENLEVEYKIVPATDSPLLLSQGDIDVMMNTYTAGVYNLVADGANIRLVATTGGGASPDAKEGFWVRKEILGGDGFQPHDLVGVPISTPFGNASSVWSVFFAEAEEAEPGVLTLESKQNQQLPYVDGVQALLNGAVNAAMVLQPQSNTVAADGCCEYVGMFPTYPLGLFYFGERLLEEDREVGEALLRAVARTSRDYLVPNEVRTDPELAAKVAERQGQPVEAFLGNVAPVWSLENMVPDPSAFESGQEYFFDAGGILSYQTPMTSDQFIDFGFVESLGLA